jgi:SAM-dependent methyltransferase
MPDNTQRFSDRVDAYVRARPGYPPALLPFLHEQLHLSPADPVADVGAGTGLLTELFVAAGHPTFAVEPNGSMRAAAIDRLGSHANFHPVDATAEATTLPDGSVALVTAAQAFHWFDVEKARAEFARILRPSGAVAIIWNERRRSPDNFTGPYQDLVDRHKVDRASATRHTMTDDALARFFAPHGFRTAAFDNPQHLDRPGVLARLASSSYMPLPPDPRHAAVIADAAELFDRHQRDGVVTIDHDTRVYYGPIT